MGNCYSADHIAEDHKQTDLTYNIVDPQQKYCLGTVSTRLLRVLNVVVVLLFYVHGKHLRSCRDGQLT